QYGKARRPHEALHAGDHEIGNTDVENLECEELRSLADRPKFEVMLEVHRDRRPGRSHERERAAAVRRPAQHPVAKHEIEDRDAWKVDIIEDGPRCAAVD